MPGSVFADLKFWRLVLPLAGIAGHDFYLHLIER